MGLQDIVAIIVVIGAISFVGRSMWRAVKGQGSCGCSRKVCGSVGPDEQSSTDRGLKRTPLVTLDQIGKPKSNDPPKPQETGCTPS